MPRRIFFPGLIIALALGCAGTQSQEGSDLKSLNTVDLAVVNVLTDSYRIYFVPYTNSQVYLGRVSAGETRRLRIKVPAQRYDDTKLLAVSMHRSFEARSIEATLLRELKPGDVIRWELSGNHIHWTGARENYK
jgi:hypothetical protein